MNPRSGPIFHASLYRIFTRPDTILNFVITLVAVALQVGHAAEPAKDDLPEWTLEQLMEIEVTRVSGAVKYEQKTTEAPSSVTVVSATEVKRYGYRTLADILQSVQGFHVSNDRNYSFLGTRGINLGDFNSRVLVLIDGHRINNNLTDGAFIDTAFLLDVDLIDRVEIIRGPGSVVYGNNAFFGVINVITRQGNQVNGAELSGEYAEFDTYKGRLTLGKQFTNGVEVLLSGTFYDSDGPGRLFYEEYDSPASNNGIARNLDDDGFGSFFGSVGYKDFTVQGGFISREKGNPTAQYFTTFNDSRLRTTDERGYAALKYAHSFEDLVDVTARAYYDRSTFEIDYPVSPTLFNEQQEGQWWGLELQLTKRLWERHTVSVGAEYRDDFHQSLHISEPSTRTVFTDTERDRQSHGVFVQGDFAVLTNLHFNGGARYDQYGDFDPSFNPRLALIYNPVETATLKAIYGTAFRTPNFLELSDPRFQDIRSEEIASYELVYEQQIGRHLKTSVSGFHNQMDDLIVFGSGSFTNFDAETTGAETALEGIWNNGIRTRASYTFQDTENRTQNRDLPDSPEHLIKFSLSVPLYKEKVFAGLEFQYTSSRHTVFTDLTGAVVSGEDADGAVLVNFTLFSQNLVKNLEFSGSVYNLFDESYEDPATRFHLQDKIPRDGRSFRIKLTYRF